MMWPRNTEWNQGSFLSQESFTSLNLKEHNGKNLLLAISHDCDIANDPKIEPIIEFVYGEVIEEKNGNYTLGKNPRVLHLPVAINESEKILELSATPKMFICKKKIISHSPEDTFKIAPKGKEILQSWLSVRYRRQALPDTLVNRLKPIFVFLEKHGKRNASEIRGYWFNYDPPIEISSNEPYDFSLYVVYSEDNQNAKENAENLVSKIKKNYPSLMKKSEQFGSVELLHCEAYSDSEFTLRDMLQNTEFRLEYISF